MTAVTRMVIESHRDLFTEAFEDWFAEGSEQTPEIAFALLLNSGMLHRYTGVKELIEFSTNLDSQKRKTLAIAGYTFIATGCDIEQLIEEVELYDIDLVDELNDAFRQAVSERDDIGTAMQFADRLAKSLMLDDGDVEVIAARAKACEAIEMLDTSLLQHRDETLIALLSLSGRRAAIKTEFPSDAWWLVDAESIVDAEEIAFIESIQM